MIKPTVGRVMWYRPSAGDMLHMRQNSEQPFAAHVAYVWNDHMVNLLVIDHVGRTHPVANVPIIQDGSPHTGRLPCAEWMPYQKGQAAKLGALEATLKATVI